MKKVSLLVVLLIGTLLGFGQNLSLGVKAGLNIAKETDSDSKVAPFFGGYVTYMVTEKFGVQPELLFSGQGGQETNPITVKDYLLYMNIPVLFRYQPIKLLNFHTGPQLGFLLSAKATVNGNTANVNDQFKSTDLGWAFGAGVDLPNRLNFALRYIVGLTNIIKDTSNGTDKNSVIQFTVGYKLFSK